MKYVLTDGGLYQALYLYKIQVKPNFFCLDLESFQSYISYLTPSDEVLLIVHNCSDISCSAWVNIVFLLRSMNINFRLFSNVIFKNFEDLEYYYYTNDLLSGSRYKVTMQKKKPVFDLCQMDVLMEMVASWKTPDADISICMADPPEIDTNYDASMSLLSISDLKQKINVPKVSLETYQSFVSAVS